MTPLRIGICVLNYRNYRDTIECVRSIDRMQYEEVDVVIVDNDSRNESEATLRKTFPHHAVLQSGRNLGYAGGNNTGLRYLIDRGVDIVMALNNDAVLPEGFLTRLVRHATERPQVGVFGALVVRDDGSVDRVSMRRIPSLLEVFAGRGGFLDPFTVPTRPTAAEVVSGCCLILRVSLLKEIGLLDEGTFLYWEEFILAEKVRDSSYTTMVFPDLRVHHEGGQSVKHLGRLSQRVYLESMNHYLATYRGIGPIRRRLIRLGPLTLNALRSFYVGLGKRMRIR